MTKTEIYLSLEDSHTPFPHITIKIDHGEASFELTELPFWNVRDIIKDLQDQFVTQKKVYRGLQGLIEEEK